MVDVQSPESSWICEPISDQVKRKPAKQEPKTRSTRAKPQNKLQEPNKLEKSECNPSVTSIADKPVNELAKPSVAPPITDASKPANELAKPSVAPPIADASKPVNELAKPSVAPPTSDKPVNKLAKPLVASPTTDPSKEELGKPAKTTTQPEPPKDVTSTELNTNKIAKKRKSWSKTAKKKELQNDDDQKLWVIVRIVGHDPKGPRDTCTNYKVQWSQPPRYSWELAKDLEKHDGAVLAINTYWRRVQDGEIRPVHKRSPKGSIPETIPKRSRKRANCETTTTTDNKRNMKQTIDEILVAVKKLRDYV